MSVMERLIGAIYFVCAATVIIVVAGLSTGCGFSLAAQSAPPPGRVARLDEVNGFWGLKYYKLEISQGVAIAVTCQRVAEPCKQVSVRSTDPKKVEVHAASLQTLEKASYNGNQTPSSGVVLVGKEPGTAKLTVTTENKSHDIYVTVVAPPVPAAPARVAK